MGQTGVLRAEDLRDVRGSVKTETKGAYLQYPYSILVKVDESDRKALKETLASSTRRTWGRRAGSVWI